MRTTMNQDGPLWNTRQNWGPLQSFTINNKSLFSTRKKGIYPVEGLKTL